MNREEFLNKLRDDILQTDQELNEEMEISDIEDWDSLAVITTIAFFDKELSKKITFNDIKNAKSIKDIILLAGDSIID